MFRKAAGTANRFLESQGLSDAAGGSGDHRALSFAFALHSYAIALNFFDRKDGSAI
jgi:hypothetical protein